MTDAELTKAIARYNWYHRIEVRPGIFTTPEVAYTDLWEFIKDQLSPVDFKGKEVVDVGCRDGMFSFLSEQAGASAVHAFDNNISSGAMELLIPEFKSKVEMDQANLYELPPRYRNADIVMFFCVLYHLRFPFNGLKCVLDFLKPGGLLLIETALLDEPSQIPLLYCPYRSSPYDPSSVSFFNKSGLTQALDSMNCTVQHVAESTITTPSSDGAMVRRCWLECLKIGDMAPDLKAYWSGVHNSHSD